VTQSAATVLMCDLAKYQAGKISLNDIRQNWANGKYAGAPREWAIAAIDHAKKQKLAPPTGPCFL
jgi:hypothetical protein